MYMNRYIQILIILLAAELTCNSAQAQGTTGSTGPTVKGSVYGGGNLAEVGGSVTVKMEAGTVAKDVYGGGALANTNTNNTDDPSVNTTTVNLTGGMINGDAYGGGLGRIAESVHYTQEEADAYNSEHNLSSGDEGFKTTADWLPEVKATVYGDINVNLGKTDASSATKFNISKYSGDHSGVVKSGRVFGCNNLNGSPQGNVTVTVYTTVKGSHDKTPAGTDGKAPKTVSDDTSYRVAAVYGGGNLANYAPTATGKKTHVVINGCDDTSIEYVYGGGNAADVPETDVDINEAYEIGTVFGGGNGKDQYTLDGTTWNDNAGADVNGNANTILYGGTIHEAFGGSNEKGTISGSVYINTSTCATCPLNVGKIYGAGKNADINGDLIIVLGCKEARTEEVYGGAENANVKGNVELTITSGEFGKVFGGNNQSGAIFGHIKLNIQETSCTPIKIDELYLGGNEAAYSIYGYYVDGTNPITGKPLYKPRSAEMHNTATTDPNYQPAEDNPTVDDDHPFPYDDPELNIISCESIGMVFGGGFGEGAALYGNPTVNINQTYPLEYDETTKAYKVKRQSLGAIGGGYEKNSAHVDGGVFGGGNEATVYGNTTVNIGTETSVNLIVFKYDENGQPVVDGDDIHQTETITGQTFNKVLGANIVGNVYGGGNKADVTGNTFVNICAKKGTGDSYTSVAFTTDQVIIGGNVFGGGKGVGDSFTCEKAMVGIDGAGADADNYPNYSDGNTTIVIGNGTVTGNVYGGGEIGRVEMNTSVTIGLGDGVASGTVTSAPEIQHSVFGGGKGLETHGYSALVRGNPTVIIQGNAKVRDNVYGGGQIASVARYKVAADDDEGAPYGVKKDMPYALLDPDHPSGICTVTVQGYAEIGPATIDSEAETTLVGHVFGAGKGIVPGPGGDYAFVSGTTKRMVLNADKTASIWETFADEAAYITFIKTLALASQTYVTIDGNAKVKGSVFGGSESGFVQFDTNVNVTGGTIGTQDKGGADFGNVYGGGKGDAVHIGVNVTYVDAGLVKGDTKVKIEGGTILHNIYGGGAYGTVGEFVYNTSGMPTGRRKYIINQVETETTGGNTEVYVIGGTIGTNGSENGMIFGSSRGDVGASGSIHDKLAWVYDTHVAIGDTIATTTATTTPLIKGSVYGGGENGHNFHSSFVRINGGTIGITEGEPIGTYTAGGASYPYRGNVYGGGCGTDMYDSNNDGVKDAYNPLAGIVRGDATIRMTAGHVVHNMYGAGAMGSVGDFEKDASTNAITFNSGGTTTIAISGGTIGVNGTAGEGNVYGAARGDKAFTDRDLALVNTTSVTISGSTQIKGNVYGGGEVGNVQTDTRVDVQGGAIAKNVFGGGKGVGDLFTCEQAMVGVDGEGAGANLDADENKDKGTIVTITNGTVGTLNEGTLVEGTGNVYGGGEIGRVEWNAQVIIGSAIGTSTPVIHGNVFGAGKGLETHGYSALVRGNSTVTVQGGAKVGHCVYGGGENSTVGRYWVKGINNSAAGAPAAPEDLPDGMPYQQQSGGICRVTIQGNAVIGGDNNADLYTGHVFGAGKGVVPHFTAGTTNRMVNNDNGGSLVVFANKTDATTGEVVKTAEELYLEFLQTLSLATNAYVTIDGSAQVKGSVFGGSESGFVQTNTDVRILNGTIGTPASYGNVFGGGRGLEAFAEAGKVKGTTEVTISGGTAYGNVYGGGNLGDVGIITKNTTDYNYTWNQSDGVTVNAHYNNTITGTNTNTGICKVTIAGGTIGVENTAEPTKHGNVFGAGRGLADTWWCEKAIAYATNVTVNKGTVYGNVYGGGEVGRVEDDAKVTVGDPSVTENLTIKGSVFGAGAGLATHGYSALVRGNTDVLVQGKAQVGGSVYGGGEIASVGRFKVISGLPSKPQAGGTCTVKIQGNARIGASGTGHNVYGACKGVTPAYNNTQGDVNRSKSMQLFVNCPKNADNSLKDEHVYWDYYESDHKYIWVYYPTEADYLEFLQTLALTSNTHVTIDGSAEVYGSVYGGGERGVTLGGVDVNMKGGTVHQDVYGGGSLADSNRAMWDAANRRVHDYVELIDLIPGLSIVTGYYTKSGDTYSSITTPNAPVVSGTQYYAKYKTNVNLIGGTIEGDAYGGGLGRKEYGSAGQDGYVSPIEAMVYGDVLVELNNNNNGGTANGNVRGCAVNRVFGCNNLNGTPKGKVKVFVYATQNTEKTSISGKAKGNYDVQAVYGGGNLAKYEPVDALLDYETNKTRVDAARPEVIVDGCALTSIRQVYGGGNAAPVPATFVEIRRAYEIEEVFGGGNGFDNYSLNEGNTTVWYENPGANVGYYTYASYPKGAGQGTGTMEDPYKAVETPAYAGGADNKEERLAAKNIQYGSGIARLEVKGGTIHTSYGGSNSKGNVRAKLSSAYSAMFDDCEMQVAQSYGGGKNAYSDAETDMVADCAKGVKEMFGGAKDADMDGDINMLITNGSSLERVFGGNNTSGAVNGSITITLQEGGCEPIKIGELYAGGFLAPYSVYGYEKNEDGSYKTESVKYLDENNVEQTKLQRIPLESGTRLYKDPRINVISATSIGNIFGGGYQAKLVGNPHINVNMTTGFVKVTKTLKAGTTDEYIYKDVAGNEYAAEKVSEVSSDLSDSEAKSYIATTDLGTIGNIYGGGNMADIIGDTYVEIGTGTWVTSWNEEGQAVYEEISPARNGAKITGNVFGGGKGKADSFKCAKAMVGAEDSGSGSTNVIIGNGTIGGTVYGGGEIGRVEANTIVTIGLEEGTGEPVIEGNVFGAGRGAHTHGYAALVRGNTTVTVQGEAKVRKSVYGGGEIASVGKYNIADAAYHAEHPEVLVGMPYSLVSDNKGICNVIVKGNAVIGPEGFMEMKAAGGPDDTGHVFGAGKGVLPYHDIDGNIITDDPWRVKPGDIVETFNEATFSEDYYTALYGSDYNKKLYNYLADYLRFIETLALTTQTEVTIGGNAFVKGSVYGGSENGHVQHNTHVTIQDDCQIGHSEGVSRRFTEDEWRSEDPSVLKECASWDYVATEGAPYDPLATSTGTYDYTDYPFVPEADRHSRPTSDGGKPMATDGHTYYGNVFGGGSGVVPYAPGRWHREAGSVGGNTQVDITGGHIMTSVYGGNEQTDVGTYELDPDNDFQPTIPKSGGKCTINMTGGTLGVPRTPERMKTHPVTCYLFGAGKGDQRIFFNTWTNVINTEVNISGTAKIYGSTFGGGEDGHVILNAVTNISGDQDKVIIGTTGTSYVDGNVFGGGRGFSGEAQTAGTVGGNVEVNISGGTMLGSIYGGGRLASVGTLFTAPDNPNYGNFVEDGGGKTYGHVAVNISGGIIGNTVGNAESGNVFGGSMGRLTLLDGTTINPIWPKMAQVKEAKVTISGDAVIKRNVYGGGELGTVRDNATVNIYGGTVNRDVYGAGYGSKDYETKTKITVKMPKEGVTNPTSASDYDDVSYVFTPMIFAGCVGQNTYVNIAGGKVRKSVYGGGEMASVGIIDCRVKIDNNATDPVYTEGTDKYVYKNFHSHLDENNGFALSWPFHFENAPGYFGETHVNITGGRIGIANGDTDINTDNGDVYGGGKGIAGEYKNYVYCANVGSAEVTIDYPAGNTATPQNYMTNADIECIAGAVYGGAENGHVMGDTKLTLKNGLIGHSMYGGGSGKGKFSTTLLKIGSTSEHYTREIYSITAGKVFGNSTVEMSGGTVVRNVYGGGNMGSVGKGNYAGGADDYSTSGYGETLTGNLWDNANDYSKAFLGSGKCTVNITGGTIGYIDESDPSSSMYPWNSTASLPYGNVFGGCRGESAPNIVETPRYLYSPEFFVGYANETAVTIGKTDGSGPTILGSVYGGGMDGHIRRDASVTILGGEIGIPFTEANKTKVKTSDLNDIQWLARGNVYGSGSGIGKYKYDFDYDGKYEHTVKYNNGRATVDTKEEDYSTSAGSVTRFTTVDIKGGTIHRNVYGGGSLSSIGAPKIGQSYDPYHPSDSEHSSEVGKQSLNKVTISGGQIGDADCLTSGYGGDVNGGSRGAMAFENSLANPASFANSVYTEVTISDDADVKGNVFGGGEAGIVKHDTEVKMQGGTVGNDLYGGGDLADVGGNTVVDMTGGTIKHDAFGGARGTADVAAEVKGKATVTLNGTKFIPAFDTNGILTGGRIFGANNVNGTPKGHVKVHVLQTVDSAKDPSVPLADRTTYDVGAVYGGGNNADYKPTETTEYAEVIIDGCEKTSIKYVFGGGNAAATPANEVMINGCYIIDNVFGGGNGTVSPANVGYDEADYKTMGTAKTNLSGGYIHNVYGGSNNQGNILGGASVTNEKHTGEGCCDNLQIQEIYGGGKQADMFGGAEIVLGCMPNDWIGAIYAGAENADVGSDVSLTLTSGKFERVFGGNKSGGRLNGGIELNIEENPGCSTPIIIGELYGGGNEAPYSIYGYKGLDANGKGIPRTESDYKALPDAQKEAEGILSGPNHNPVVNVKAFTSIGNIFGGGYGGTAVMIGNPIVNINEVEFDKTETGYMSNAYGGETKQIGTGDEAVEVVLYPHEDGKMGVIGNVFGGGNSAEVIGNPNVNIGTAAEVGFESLRTSEGVPKKPVLGADIRGNVYGGGNNAAVTGDPKVVIGQRKE